MRKLKLQVQTTIDGFMAGPNGEMDWLVFDWDEALKDYVTRLTTPVDCIVLGRKLAEGFIPHWASLPADADGAEKINTTPKVVFTQTLQRAAWANTVLATGDIVTEINQLKAQSGHDILAYGGASFVSSLIRHNLVDEFHLFVNPVAIGSGLPVFGPTAGIQPLQLIQSTAFACGIVVLQYAPRR